ncbi:MAG: ABC transporter permease subunit [Gammaproteobacteria bacterium]|nr:ABC transporter permease subunit [Gammaproteobacteria bacterium]
MCCYQWEAICVTYTRTFRNLVKYGVPAVCWAAGLIAVLLILALLSVIFLKGYHSLEPGFVLEESREAGASGGIRYQIIGTLILVLTTAAAAIPVSLAIGITRVSVLKHSSLLRHVVDGGLQMLNSMPSILFGVLGFMLFTQHFGWGKSWLAGGIILGLMIVPIVSLAFVNHLLSLPPNRLEAAYGLGLSPQQVLVSVWLPHGWPGLVSGLFLGLARAMGETAPILFVAAVFSGAGMPLGITDSPVLALPYHIFVMAQDSFDSRAQANAWGTALVLVMLVLAFNGVAYTLRMKLHYGEHH